MIAEAPGFEFLDSNVLIYAYDGSAEVKHRRASELVSRLWYERRGALSIQVLQEFLVNVTRKVPIPLTLRQAAEIVSDLAAWRIHSPETSDVLAALELQERYRISFWDSMILRSAKQTGCAVLWSEDLNTGQSYGGVEVLNPFAP